VNVQERRACHLHTPLQRFLDVLKIIKPLGAKQVYEQMRSGEPYAITLNEVVFPVVVRA
jgi:hypothetical protein